MTVRERKRQQYWENLLASMTLLEESLRDSRAEGALYLPDEYRKRFSEAVRRLEFELRQTNITRLGFRHKVLLCTRSLGPAYFPNRVTIHQIGCPRAPKDGQASGPYGWRVIDVSEVTAPKMLAAYATSPNVIKVACRSCGGLKKGVTDS